MLLFPFKGEGLLLFPLRFILVGTTHPGNIGACARALKTMGWSDWVLVNPCDFSADEGPANAMAAGAEDWLKQVRVVNSLKEAIKDCVWVVGTSTRVRDAGWPIYTPKVVAERALSFIQTEGPVALLFGRESHGLSNEELSLCQAQLSIPANEQYASLNIASALQIVAYECRMKLIEGEKVSVETQQVLARSEELELFFQHLEQVLMQIEFFNPQQQELLMIRLRRLFQRTQLEHRECKILRGILSQVQRKCR